MKPLTASQWRRKWPAHCPACLARTDSADPCQQCLEQLICPRCGRLETEDGANAIDPEDAAIPCRVCGWVETFLNVHGCPLTRAEVRQAKRDAEAEAERARAAKINYHRRQLAELEKPKTGARHGR